MNEDVDATVTAKTDLVVFLTEFRQPIDAEDSMSEAGRKVLLEELIKMIKRESGSRTGEDIEDVHDMRVATRRMRSALRLLEPYFKQKAIAAYDRSLRKLARVLGTVRDLDVQIDDLQKGAEALPDHAAGLAGAIALLDSRRADARAALVRLFDRGSYRRFVQDYAAFLTSPGKGARETDPETVHPFKLRHVLPEMIYKHLGSVRAYNDVLDDADMTTLHALRIEFKRLRYVVSLFGDVLGTSAAEFVAELKLIQDHLGRLNDMSIAHERLTELTDEFAGKDDADVRAALGAYIESIAAQEEVLRAGMAAVWNKFNTKRVQRQLAMAVAGL
ncbi:MAG: CHAD domain-containing protein [Chloroflexota bacterium]|nr:CHAD domain-containing protein [Chloroflexota bacterium]